MLPADTLTNLNRWAVIACDQVVLILCSGETKRQACQGLEVTITLAALLCPSHVRGRALHQQPVKRGPCFGESWRHCCCSGAVWQLRLVHHPGELCHE